jgi:hypothetical protein
MKLYTYDTYREIVKKQFAAEMEKVSMPLQGSINPEVYQKYQDALLAKEDQTLKVKTAGEAFAKDKENADLKKIFMDEKAKLKEVNKEHKSARYAVDQALKETRSQEVNKSLAYNEKGERVGVAPFTVAKLGERLVNRDDAQLLHDYIGVAGYIPKSEESHFVQRAAGVFGRTIRQTTASFDFATPFVHGLPTLANNPIGWSKAVAGQFRAFVDPKFVAQYQVENGAIINEMRQYGVDVSSNEFFELSTSGEGGKAWNKVTGKLGPVNTIGKEATKQTMGRLQSAMAMNLMITRVELWKANKDAFLKDQGIMHTGIAQGSAHADPMAGLAQYVRNMSGALDARDLLVSKNQRDLESLWLAFSPKLFRSTLSLVGMATKPTTVEGRAALRSLAVMSTAAALTFYGLNRLSGNSHEESLASINPSNTRQFMSVKVGDGYYGIGGQMRSVAQLLGQSGKAIQQGDFSDFKSWDQAQNPLLRFYVGRGAPALSLTQNTIEAASGGKINSNPYEQVNGIFDMSDFTHSLVATTGKDFLPFVAQNKLQGENAPQLAFETFGGRYTKFSRAEETDQRVLASGYKKLDGTPATTINDLNKEQKDDFYKKNPVAQITSSDNVTKMFSSINDEEAAYQADILKYTAFVDAGKMTKEQFKDWYNQRSKEKFAKIAQVKKDASIQPANRPGFTGSVTDYINSKNTRPEDRAVDEYYNVSATTPLTEQGTVNFDLISKRRNDLLSSLPTEQAAYVRRMVNKPSQTPDSKLVTEYDIVKDITKPYWEAEGQIFDALKEKSGFLAQFGSKDAYDKWVQQTSQESGLTPATFQAYLSKKVKDVASLDKITTDYKKRMRLSDPQLDRALTEWYGMEPANRVDYLLSGFGSDQGAAMASQIYNGDGPSRAQVADFGLNLAKSGLRTQPRKFYRPKEMSLKSSQS